MRLEVLKGKTITGNIAETSDGGMTFIYGDGDRFFVRYSMVVDPDGDLIDAADVVSFTVTDASFEGGELQLEFGQDGTATFYDVEDLTDTNGNTFEDFEEDGIDETE